MTLCETCGIDNESVKNRKVGENTIMQLCKECRKKFLKEDEEIKLSRSKLIEFIKNEKSNIIKDIEEHIIGFNTTGLYEMVGSYRTLHYIQWEIEDKKFDFDDD